MRAIVERASSYPRRWLKSPPLRGGSVELEAGREGNSKRKLVKTVVSVVVVESAQPLIRRECDVQLGGGSGGNLFAEIRLREIRCEVEVGRGSCALFAKAKVDARERLEFTEGSTPRERCLSVTTADTRECLEILVFLFLVTLSLSLPLPLSAVFSYHFTRAPRDPPLLPIVHSSSIYQFSRDEFRKEGKARESARE